MGKVNKNMCDREKAIEKQTGFGENFVWGVGTAAFQIEGAQKEDGRGKSIWDVFEENSGRIYNDQNAKQACDHYHHWKEDLELLKELSVKAYRFSISWSRIFPEGTGKVNEAGIAFYDNIVNRLLELGITPYITLYHWDLPYTLYQKGGWMNPDSVNWFAEYAEFVVKHFSDRVKYYFTFNEPQCFIGLSYGLGKHAPGLHTPIEDRFLMAHHVMMAHGKAVQAMRSAATDQIQIGYAPTCGVIYPETETDVELARKIYFSCNPDAEQALWSVPWWSDPVIFGRYPEDGLRYYEPYLPHIGQEDLKLMAQPLDFYGQNIYNGIAVTAGDKGEPVFVKRYNGFPRTAYDWPVTPEALYWGPKFLCERYQLSFYITENGMSCHDWVSLDGKVHDPNRIDFTHRYLKCLKKACAEHDIRGYFHWTLLDDYEWNDGYKERFGLVYVDYRTQIRTRKDSFAWYQNVIKTNGAEI